MVAQTLETPEIHNMLGLITDASPFERAQLESQIFDGCASFVESMVRRYRDKGVAHDDLFQVANLGLLKAIRGFDAERGNFFGYAKVTVLGELRKYFRDYAWVVRPTRGLQELQPKVRTFEASFVHTEHRWPSVSETAAALDEPKSDVVMAKTCNGYSVLSLDATFGPDNDDRLLGETLADGKDDIDHAEVWASITPIIAELDVEERRLLRLRFVEDRTQVEIGEVLGIPQMQVSRRLARVLASIRDRYGNDDLPIAV